MIDISEMDETIEELEGAVRRQATELAKLRADYQFLHALNAERVNRAADLFAVELFGDLAEAA